MGSMILNYTFGILYFRQKNNNILSFLI